MSIIIQQLIQCPAGMKPHKAVDSVITKISLSNFLKKYTNTQVTLCLDASYFNYNEYNIKDLRQNPECNMTGHLKEVYRIKIPQAKFFFDSHQICYINDFFIAETRTKSLDPTFRYEDNNQITLPQEHQKILGDVAIIVHYYPDVYGHFIFDILGGLSLFEMDQITYDYLCIPHNKQYMKDALALWGIDSNKILIKENYVSYEATNVLIHTGISRDDICRRLSHFYPPEILLYVRNKILNKIQSLNIDLTNLPKKIFISRQDAPYRRLPNEDEIFSIFEQKGYVRYCLSQLNFIEQVTLFHNATNIVGPAGSNMANVLFANSNVHYLEFIQVMPDATFFAINQILGLNYHCISDSTIKDLKHGHPGSIGRPLDPQLVIDFLTAHPEY